MLEMKEFAILVNSFRGARGRRDQHAVPVGTVPQHVQELDQYRIVARMINRRVKLSVALHGAAVVTLLRRVLGRRQHLGPIA